jgi:hypothetical protein
VSVCSLNTTGALLAKNLPAIRSRRNMGKKNARRRRLSTWARGLCEYLGWTERQYRKFKSNPEHGAHDFQRLMCNNNWDSLDFNTVSGKALFNLISQRGKDRKNVIERHNLEKKYLEWIQSQPVAKFTGYPFELYMAASTGSRTLMLRGITYDAQFEGLLKTAKEFSST